VQAVNAAMRSAGSGASSNAGVQVAAIEAKGTK